MNAEVTTIRKMNEKVDFCPFELGSVQPGAGKTGPGYGFGGKYAYRLEYYEGFDGKEWVKVKTNLSAVTDAIISKNRAGIENSLKRTSEEGNRNEENYLPVHYREKGWPQETGMTGMEILLYAIDNNGNRPPSKQNTAAKVESDADESDAAELVEKYGMMSLLEEAADEAERFSVRCQDIEGEAGCVEFFYCKGDFDNGRPFMKAIPCCPYCQRDIPSSWFEADDYCAISLLGWGAVGKSTYKAALLRKHGLKLQNSVNRWSKGQCQLEMTADIMNEPEVTEWLKNAEKLTMEGICPDQTMPGEWVPPLMLKIVCDSGEQKKTMIVILFDNPGELMGQIATRRNNRLRFLRYASGHIYMVEPYQIENFREMKGNDIAAKSVPELLSLEEQAAMQAGETLEEQSGEIRKDEDSVTASNKDIMECFAYLMADIGRRPSDRYMKDQHFAFCVCKFDKYEDLKELKNDYSNDPDRLAFLFRRESDLQTGRRRGNRSGKSQDISPDSDARGAEEDFIEKYVLEPDDMETIEQAFPDNVSWHCISTLGSQTENIAPPDSERPKYRLLSKLDPIRLEEPFIACIGAKMRSIGWIK